MQKLRRRVEQQEDSGVGGGEGMMGMGVGSNSGRCSQAADTFSQPSPASSNTSLNALEYPAHHTHNGTHSAQQVMSSKTICVYLHVCVTVRFVFH